MFGMPHRLLRLSFPVFAGGLIIICVAGMTAWRSWNDHAATARALESRLIEDAKSGELQIMATIAPVDALLREIDDDLSNRPGLVRTVDYAEQIRLRMQWLKGARIALVTDAQGIIDFATDERVMGIDTSSRGDWARLSSKATDKTYLSSHFDAATQSRVVNVSRARRDIQGAFIGIVSVTMLPELFQDIADAVAPRDIRGYATIFSETRDLVARAPAPKGAPLRSIKESDFFATPIATGATSLARAFVSPIDDIERIGVLHSLGNIDGLLVAVAVNKQETWQPFWSRTALLWSIFGLIAALTIALTRRLARTERKLIQSGASISQELAQFHDVVSRSLEVIDHGLIIVDPKDRIYLVNKTLQSFFPVAGQLAVPGANAFEFSRAIVASDIDLEGQSAENWMAARDLRRQEKAFLQYQGRLRNGRHLEFTARRFDQEWRVITVVDVTQRLRESQDLVNRNRALRALYASSDAIAWAGDEATMLQNICEVVCRESGYRLAWLARFEPNSESRLQVLAKAGPAVDYLSFLARPSDIKTKMPGPVGLALIDGEPRIVNDIATDPRFVYWRKDAAHHGLKSAAAFRIGLGAGESIALGLYSPDANGFSDVEIALMIELAGKIGNGLLTLRTRLARDVAMLKAEEASKAKADFLSSMTHELRTPLNVVLGFAQLLSDDTDHPLAPDQAASIREISVAGRRLLGLVDNILDIADIGADTPALDIDQVPIADLVSHVVASLSPLADQSEITVDNRADRTNFAVRANGKRLREALMHLVTNAIKFNRPGGKVWIEATKAGSDFVRISVGDDGPGIPTTAQSKLFQPFERLGRESGAIAGAGVGLMLSKHFVTSMGGRIGVQSKEGEGSLFQIELPEAWTGG